MNDIIVMKFGGSSVADIEKIDHVADLILRKKQQHAHIAVVVSAMGKTTNNLIAMAEEITNDPSAREMDALLATGEMITAALLAITLERKGARAISLTGAQGGLQTFGYHRKAKIGAFDTGRIERELSDGKIVVFTGFQGVDASGDTTTLGRGGSDTSAVALAAALSARCEIYTDVEGIYSVDPRIYAGAKKLDRLSYGETLEMATLGASVIEPRSVELAQKYKVPLYIALNTGEVPGTMIQAEEFMMEQDTITNISKVDNVLLVRFERTDDVQNQLVDCFDELAKAGVNIDILSRSPEGSGNRTLSFTSTADNKIRTAEILMRRGIPHRFIDAVSKVSIIGNAMRTQVGVVAKALRAFEQEQIDFYEVTTSEISLSYVVDSKDANRLVNALANAFDL